MIALIGVVVLTSLASVPQQHATMPKGPAAVQPPDCRQPVTAPSPGMTQMCAAEEAVRVGNAAEKGSEVQRQHWMDAADQYMRAAGQVRTPELHIYALEAIIRLSAAEQLNDAQRAELALRELIGLMPSDPAPIFRLARLQEEQARFDEAESTLLSARQQHVENVEVYRELSQYFERRASTLEAGAPVSRPDPSRPDAADDRGAEAPDAQGYYRVGGKIAAPAKLHDSAPEYPPGAQAAGVEGLVVLELSIDETGAVVDAKVVRSVQMLDEAALAAARQWRFAPSMIDGRPVPAKITVPVPFRR